MSAPFRTARLNLPPTRCFSTSGNGPRLPPRRSTVTVSALIAAGQSAQIGYHLNRAMDNGLSAEEAGEVVARAAFYAGWPNAFTAAPVVGEVLRSRESKTE